MALLLDSVYLQALYVSLTNIQIITILIGGHTEMQTSIYCLPKQEGEMCVQISTEPLVLEKIGLSCEGYTLCEC